MKRKVLALDLSTKCVGWALFCVESKKLLKCGYIKSTEKGLSKLKYPQNALEKILRMTPDVLKLIKIHSPDALVVEEVNRGISRIGQKSLDALHFFILNELRTHYPELLRTLTYIDSNGRKGWRTVLGMKLSEEDKKRNAFIRKSKDKKGIVNWKHLAARYVNDFFKLGLDVDQRESDGDIADAICLGVVYLKTVK